MSDAPRQQTPRPTSSSASQGLGPRARWLVLATGAGLLLAALWLGLAPEPPWGHSLTADLLVAAAALVTATALATAARRTSGRARLAWVLLAAGLASIATGELLSVGQGGLHHALGPAANPADAVILTGYALLAAGMAVFAVRGARGPGRGLQDLLDGLLVGFSLLVVSWTFLLAPLVETAASGGIPLGVALAYALMDITLVSVVAVVAAHATGARRARLWWVASGLLLWVLHDSLAVYLGVRGVALPPVVEVVEIAGFALIALGAIRPPRPDHVVPRPEPLGAPAWLIPYGPVGLAVLVASYAYATQGGLAPVLFGAGIAIVLAYTARQALAMELNARLAQDLHDSQEQLRLLAAHVDENFWILETGDREPCYLSPGWEVVFGTPLPPLEEAGEAWLAAVHPKDRERARQNMIHFLEAGRAGEVDYRVVDPDGTVRWVETCFRPVTEDGEVRRFIGVSRDITASKRAERVHAQAARREAELEHMREMDRFKTRFLNTAAHELSTPLTPVKFQLQALSSGMLGEVSDEQRRALEVLERNIERFGRLTRDLLDAARLQAGRLSIHPRAFDLGDAVEHAAGGFIEMAAEQEVLVELDLDEGVTLEGDPDRIGQIVVNLLDNALKFTPAGGHVAVRVRRHGDGGRVEVQDTGTGLPPGDLEGIFAPFTRSHQHAQGELGGTGLGLYISRALAEQHGGTLTAYSQGAGQGATFRLELPATGPERRDPADAARQAT